MPQAQLEGERTHLRGAGTAPRGSPFSVFSKYLTYFWDQAHEYRAKKSKKKIQNCHAWGEKQYCNSTRASCKSL